MVIYRGLSELHQVLRGQTVTADYYVSEVLENTKATTMQQKKEIGLQPKSNSCHTCLGIFKEDGVFLAHRSRKERRTRTGAA